MKQVQDKICHKAIQTILDLDLVEDRVESLVDNGAWDAVDFLVRDTVELRVSHHVWIQVLHRIRRGR